VTSETPPTSSDSTDSKGTSAAVDTPKSSGSSEDQDGGARGGDGGDGDGGGGGGGDKEPVEEHTDEPEGPSLGDTFACVSGESLPEDARVHPDFLDKVEPSRVWTTFMLHMFLPTLDPSFSAPDFLDGAKQVGVRVAGTGAGVWCVECTGMKMDAVVWCREGIQGCRRGSVHPRCASRFLFTSAV